MKEFQREMWIRCTQPRELFMKYFGVVSNRQQKKEWISIDSVYYNLSQYDWIETKVF